MRNGTSPADPNPMATPPSTSPTAHEMRTMTSVRFGPCRSHSQPQTKLITIATTVSMSRMSVGVAFGQAHRLHHDDAHDDDDRVDRVGVEEPADQEPPQARAPRARARSTAELTERVADLGGRDRRAREPRLAHEQEDRDREHQEQDRRQAEAIDDRDVEQEDQQPDEDRPAVADAGPDPRQLAPGRRVADRS